MDHIPSTLPADSETPPPDDQLTQDYTVLDYVKDVLRFRHFIPERLWQLEVHSSTNHADRKIIAENATGPYNKLVLVLVLLSALVAQISLESGKPAWPVAIGGYGLSALLVMWWLVKDDIFHSPSLEKGAVFAPLKLNWVDVSLAIFFTMLSFLLFGHNQFTSFNVFTWSLAIYFVLRCCLHDRFSTFRRLSDFFQGQREINLDLKSLILVIAVLTIVLFFRFYQLNIVPGEMWSDHAEKLLDTMDVLNGDHSIFFPRNTGREGFQIYLTAFIAKYIGLGISFISLKLGTVLAGLAVLGYLYLLAREFGEKELGVMAVLLMGIAYWPNLISRVGLRYAIYTLFAVPVMYHLVRGLRKKSLGHLAICGLFLGLGLHGYSAFRIVPLLVLIGLGFYWFAHRRMVATHEMLTYLGVIVAVSLVIFLPLARYAFENPQMFAYRAFSRLGTTERVYPDSVFIIFWVNLWRSTVMPFLNNGDIWVHSVPGRPALDVISAVFYFIGLIGFSYRSIKTKDWKGAFLLISIPILMLPSILSLAFPDENPSLNRSAAAAAPIFLIAAWGWVWFWQRLIAGAGHFGKLVWQAAAVLLVAVSIYANYDIVFNQYRKQFDQNAWNASEMGAIIKGFSISVGSYDHAYVIPYAYWVDTRLVAISAGYPAYEIAVWPDQIEKTKVQTGSKLFLLKTGDTESLHLLQSIYSGGYFWQYPSRIKGKEFTVYFIPAMP